MWNLLPGQGLGFTGSKEIAFGLAPVSVTVIEPEQPVTSGGGGGGYSSHVFSVFDNAYSKRKQDEQDIIDFINIIFGVIE